MNAVLRGAAPPLAPRPRRAALGLRRGLRSNEWYALLASGVLLLTVAAVAAASGAYAISIGELARIVGESLGLSTFDGPDAHRSVLWNIRLPRVACAAVLGAGLGLAGASLQAVFRNPLADPGLIGVSGGAAAGAALAIVLLPATAAISGLVAIPLAAFAGGVGATGMAIVLANRSGRMDIATLLLAGIAVNALAGAVVGLLTVVADDARLRTLTLWSMGSAGGVSFPSIAGMLLALLPLIVLGVVSHRHFDALQLGRASATSLGIDVDLLERGTVVVSALAVAVAVSFTGIVAFVGLVAPHLARLLAGARHRSVLPLSALLGGALVIAADTASRTIAAPAELPLGVLLGFVGAPALVFLLHRQRTESP